MLPEQAQNTLEHKMLPEQAQNTLERQGCVLYNAGRINSFFALAPISDKHEMPTANLRGPCAARRYRQIIFANAPDPGDETGLPMCSEAFCKL